MHETMGVPDGKTQQIRQDAKLEGDPCRWPVYLPTAWKKMGFDASRDEAVVRVAYCVNPRCMRRIKPNEECSPNCTKCGTLWHDRLESGKAKVLSFDYFVRPSWNYQQMLALSEFGDAVADFWPTALAMMDQDPEDLSIPVNDVLSGTRARRLYCSRSDDINFNLVAGGEITLLIQVRAPSAAVSAYYSNPLIHPTDAG